MDLQLHDILELKKDHPCGSRRWEVLRVGMVGACRLSEETGAKVDLNSVQVKKTGEL